ncbi:MAG: glycosyltransferase family 1 protein [Algibacter sp.]|uniref:glycosyltransferase family 4 protein n=1 Tax=Algibacter sp. TaxID=1872428 RepID=UPI00329A0052
MHNIFLESHNIKNLNFGFGQFNYHLIKGIYNANQDDLNITVHTPKIQILKKEFGSSFKYKKYYSLRRYPIFRIKKKYDLWHAMNQNTSIEPYHNTPYLLTVHNTSHIKDITDYKNKKNNIKFQEKLNKSDGITYISNYAKASTHKYFNVPKVPEFVIYNGNPISKILLTEKHIPKINIQSPYLFTIGEIKSRKNFTSLIPLILGLKDYKLIIAGKNDTNEAEKIKKLISKHKLSNRVFLVGKISELDKQYYYKNCSAFVFPSLREGFGLPIVEAMKFEKPIFTSNNTSLPEIGGDLAFYWDNYDHEHMIEVFENGMHTFIEKQEYYKSKLAKRALSFNWDDAAKAYLKVYNTLIQ